MAATRTSKSNSSANMDGLPQEPTLSAIPVHSKRPDRGRDSASRRQVQHAVVDYRPAAARDGGHGRGGAYVLKRPEPRPELLVAAGLR
jgi:hypothetical protein